MKVYKRLINPSDSTNRHALAVSLEKQKKKTNPLHVPRGSPRSPCSYKPTNTNSNTEPSLKLDSNRSCLRDIFCDHELGVSADRALLPSVWPIKKRGSFATCTSDTTDNRCLRKLPPRVLQIPGNKKDLLSVNS